MALSRQPCSSLIILPEEVIHFDYFRTKCTEEFSESFIGSLWKQLILQAMHAESFVLDAVLAIGSLRRFQLESKDFMVGKNIPPSTVQYSIGKYNKASRELYDQLRTNTADWKVVVLGTIVFLAIEVLQGNETGAIVHFKSGSAILKSILCSSYDMRSACSHSKTGQFTNTHSGIDDLDIVVSAFARLSVEDSSFVGSNGTPVAGVPDLPTRFDSISAARSSLNSIVAFVYAFLRRWGHEDLQVLPLHPLPESVSTELAETQAVLQSWRQAFNLFLSEKKKVDTKAYLGANVLLVQHLVAWIKISTQFFRDQIIYDSYLEYFMHIVDMTRAVVEADNASWTRSRGPCFTLDIAMVQPLYFVARRCRDPALRRRAIEVMRKVGKDGIYTGKTFARVAEWIVMKEETNGFVEGVLIETSRLHDVVLDFDRVEGRLTVSATRKTRDGALNCLVEELDLPV